VATIKIPSTALGDFDFLAFSFNDKHSYDDFGIYRTSDGSRYNLELAPQLTDKTAEVPFSDGTYYFNTFHKQKVFNISFAFDHLEETKLREMKRWLDGKAVHDLWFEEEPYKVYSAKVTGQPSIKVICFDEYIGGVKKRIYKGEGTV
jgi:predicted phage tail component-like protein